MAEGPVDNVEFEAWLAEHARLADDDRTTFPAADYPGLSGPATASTVAGYFYFVALPWDDGECETAPDKYELVGPGRALHSRQILVGGQLEWHTLTLNHTPEGWQVIEYEGPGPLIPREERHRPPNPEWPSSLGPAPLV